MTALVALVVCSAVFLVLERTASVLLRRCEAPFHRRIDALPLARRTAWRLVFLLLPATISFALIVPLLVELARGRGSSLVALCERMHAHCDLFLGSDLAGETLAYGVAGLGLALVWSRLVGRIVWPALLVRLRARPVTSGASAVDAAVSRVSAGTGLCPEVRLMAGVDAAVSTGLARPVVVFEPRFLSGLTPEEVHAVLLHEVAHFQAWDATRNALLAIAGAFSPGGGESRRRRQYFLERELTSDLHAVARGADPLALASALVKAGRLQVRGTARGLGLPALPGDARSTLTTRIERLVELAGGPAPATPDDARGLERALGALLLAGGLVVGAGVWGQWGATLHCLVEDLVHTLS
jgi:Zn-dependent protease with chaperone function